MARMPRLVLPGQPHLVVLRGHGLGRIAFDDTDRAAFLASLRAALTARTSALHGYALLDEQAFLLVTPSERDALGRLVQALGRAYVAGFNLRHRRRGTIWEGRFRCGPVEAAAWLLPCLRLIESSPVAAGLARRAEDYAWSSAGHHIGLRNDPLITDHACFWSLGNTPFEREAGYREYLAHGVPADERRAILGACLHGWALGSEEFLGRIERESMRPARPRAPGRPRKILSVPD